MKKYKWILIAGNLLLLLVYFNWSVSQKEQTIKESELILFRLAPVDPRSLMQGDYMALNYEVSLQVGADPDKYRWISSQGYAILALDSNRVASIVRFQPNTGGLNAGEQLIKCREGHRGLLNFGAESFFFEEGQGTAYQAAEYGGLRVDKEGNSILIGLYDSQFQLIVPPVTAPVTKE